MRRASDRSDRRARRAGRDSRPPADCSARRSAVRLPSAAWRRIRSRFVHDRRLTCRLSRHRGRSSDRAGESCRRISGAAVGRPTCHEPGRTITRRTQWPIRTLQEARCAIGTAHASRLERRRACRSARAYGVPFARTSGPPFCSMSVVAGRGRSRCGPAAPVTRLPRRRNLPGREGGPNVPSWRRRMRLTNMTNLAERPDATAATAPGPSCDRRDPRDRARFWAEADDPATFRDLVADGRARP